MLIQKEYSYSSWTAKAQHRLEFLCRNDGSWSYCRGSTRAVEPTALAGLACLANGRETTATKAGRWLTTLQNPDGSLGVTTQLAAPGWPTPLAVLLWASLEDHQSKRELAVAWMLNRRGAKVSQVPNDPIGHDGSLVGWPWVAATHSWVEPTALALLALNRAGKKSHVRTREGVRLLFDRAIPSGGWNLGNPVVFGTALRPLPGPTGLALLALASLGEVRSAAINRGLDYLQQMIGSTLAAESLAWMVLGLRAWGCEPAAASDQITRAAERLLARPSSLSISLALLILASAPLSLGLLGINLDAP